MSKTLEKVKVKVTGTAEISYEVIIELEDVSKEDLEDEIYNDLAGRGLDEVEITSMPDMQNQDFDYEILEEKEYEEDIENE